MRRGEIWWASLAPPTGSAPGYRRPVVVIQSNEFTASRVRTVTVLAITSNLALAAAPGNVRLARRETGLSRESVANVSQVLTVDKERLTERMTSLPASLIRKIDDGLRLALAL